MKAVVSKLCYTDLKGMELLQCNDCGKTYITLCSRDVWFEFRYASGKLKRSRSKDPLLTTCPQCSPETYEKLWKEVEA